MTTSIQMIKEALATWENIRGNGATVGNYFEQGNAFFFELPDYGVDFDNIHAYPGIWENQLYFFLIPEAFDKPEYKETINNYVIATPITWGLKGSHTIPVFVAEERVTRWSSSYKEWCMFEVKKECGIFKAFNIPADDIPVGQQVVLTMGLQLKGTEGIFSADVIAASVSSAAIIQFDDFVQPVPPYSILHPESSFYLLNL